MHVPDIREPYGSSHGRRRHPAPCLPEHQQLTITTRNCIAQRIPDTEQPVLLQIERVFQRQTYTSVAQGCHPRPWIYHSPGADILCLHVTIGTACQTGAGPRSTHYTVHAVFHRPCIAPRRVTVEKSHLWFLLHGRVHLRGRTCCLCSSARIAPILPPMHVFYQSLCLDPENTRTPCSTSHLGVSARQAPATTSCAHS